MPNDPPQDSTEIIAAERLLDDSILHPANFWLVISGLVVLMIAYSLFVKNPFWIKK